MDEQFQSLLNESARIHGHLCAGQPMELVFYEATSTFIFVATRKLAHPAIRGFVDGLQKATLPSPPAIQLHGFGFLPWRDLHPQVCAALRWARQEERPDPKDSFHGVKIIDVKGFMEKVRKG